MGHSNEEPHRCQEGGRAAMKWAEDKGISEIMQIDYDSACTPEITRDELTRLRSTYWPHSMLMRAGRTAA